MADLADSFARDGYAVWRSLVLNPRLSLLYRYALLRAKDFVPGQGDRQVPDTASAHGDFMMDGLLSDLLPDIERGTGISLFPTYSYLRIYKSGDVLARHTDRPACEISVTLCLGLSPGKAWPIWIEGLNGVEPVELAPGDSLIYRGIDRPHWRNAFEGEHVAQIFLHYVDRNGPHAAERYDRRGELASSLLFQPAQGVNRTDRR
jgi:hypothetical protein